MKIRTKNQLFSRSTLLTLVERFEHITFKSVTIAELKVRSKIFSEFISSTNGVGREC